MSGLLRDGSFSARFPDRFGIFFEGRERLTESADCFDSSIDHIGVTEHRTVIVITTPDSNPQQATHGALLRVDIDFVLAGDRIEFVEERRAPEVPRITVAGIKIPLVAGTKLSQAITEVLGQKSEPKHAVVRRSGDKGVSSLEYDIRAIKKGKVLDPVLLAGDVIEIKN